jgi:hypothetical protein
MDAKVLLTGLIIFVGALIGVLYPTGVAGQREDLTKVYESCIIKKIEKCESQADFLHTSRSVTLRQYAELQDKKAEFFYLEKETLINLMIQNRLEPKQYKMEHFLEEQFYRSVER